MKEIVVRLSETHEETYRLSSSDVDKDTYESVRTGFLGNDWNHSYVEEVNA